MRVTGSGILTDHKGRVFLQQSGETTLAPVHRPLEPGHLPSHTLDRAFRQDTSLIVMPVRLTGLYYDGSVPGGDLTFCWRCTMRGGDLKVPAGGQPAGFFDWPLQRGGLSPQHSRMVDDAVHHGGGPPVLAEVKAGLSATLGRLFGRPSVESDAEPWDVAVRLVDQTSADAMEWVVVEVDEENAKLATPAGPARPPWETAMRLPAQRRSRAHPSTVPELTGEQRVLLEAQRRSRAHPSTVRLVGVELAPAHPALTLLFASDRE